jgi:hydrogenase maturation protein HypF
VDEYDGDQRDLTRRRLRLTGVVQGVGMRPHVYRLATEEGLAGTVGNDTGGVVVEVEGPSERVEIFAHRMVDELPALAMVETVSATDVPPTGEPGFRIAASTDTGADDAPVALVPADTAICPQCLAETFDPADRRYRYPFTACTFCGPRFTIVRGVPYDRPFTTMDRFPLCPACRAEYENPLDRRFHAQPTACPECGPALTFRTGDGDDVGGDAAVAAAQQLLADGGVVAVKGVGGYHLACVADDGDAVGRLRTRKRRGRKPFAIMAASLPVARRLVDVDDAVGRLLTSAQAPIVLAPTRDDEHARAVADAVAPGQSTLGVMLPYSGVHHLLLRPHPDRAEPPSQVLVMTSGNLSDEPLCTDADEAERRLAGLADGWLHHDREIHVACDDSVVQVVGGELQPVRRSRGYAPVPVPLPVQVPPTLAVGGELKATVCLAGGRRGWMSQHLGDVSTMEALRLLARSVDVLRRQSRVDPEVVVVDQHPGYLSRRWATEYAVAEDARLVLVQHHHAHLASLLAEHQRPVGEPVLGVTFDGTGYGSDGSIWGGEFLLGSYAEVRRVGHLAPVQLPGGDAAIRHPARAALAHLHAAGLPWEPAVPAVAALTASEQALLAGMLRSGTGCVPTTSVGRLFDAVSALLGVCQQADYEAQAAVELEAVIGVPPPPADGIPEMAVTEGPDGLVVDPGGVLAALVRDVAADVPVAVSAWRFHVSLAAAVRTVARHVRDSEGVQTIGLTGGVFQNAVMTTECARSLLEDGFDVLVHRRVPPNDGGLALGQTMVAACGGGR